MASVYRESETHDDLDQARVKTHEQSIHHMLQFTISENLPVSAIHHNLSEVGKMILPCHGGEVLPLSPQQLPPRSVEDCARPNHVLNKGRGGMNDVRDACT